MIDTLGKPVSVADTCATCKSWKELQTGHTRQVCHDCGEEIPPYENVPAGYDAPGIDHWHQRQVSGVSGYSVVKKILCQECYLKEYKKVFGVKLKM